MKHYICQGECGGTSEKRKKCGMESCSRFGQDMKECNCKDGKHYKN